jgi:FtsP/CotA-like multicopper oxidase with cupredoxin domain
MKRRDFMKTAGVAGAGLVLLPGGFRRVNLNAEVAAPGLSDPVSQPKFVNDVPDALAPGFKILTPKSDDRELKVYAESSIQQTGLLAGGVGGAPLSTALWGYGAHFWNEGTATWPGPTIEARSKRKVKVRWENKLSNQHLLPVDPNLHWCYSLPGYKQYTIENAGVPIVTHLHGGHTDFQYDGNPEFFFSPGYAVKGPQFVDKTYIYDNSQPAGNLWYHDHALGITRLNVYAGLAGFYFLRDNLDTGTTKNKLGLPAWPYEKAYAIQDRMFLDTGELFYPAYPGDPAYADFITGEDVVLGPPQFPDNPRNVPDLDGGGPTALAEFFGDHMVVNGKIWPKEDVEPRIYRLHLLNGTDSRFMAIQLFEVPSGAKDFSSAVQQLSFTVIGSDQGLASSPTTMQTLLSEPGSRYDIIVDFKNVTPGNRVIMKNIGGDEPFGGDIPGPQIFDETDKIMAFDVVLPFNAAVSDVNPNGINFGPNVPATPTRLRKVALFEGKDEFGRLQPLLGTAEPATDYQWNMINWPAPPVTNVYSDVGLVGPMEGSIAWHSPTTENPALGTTEEWEIWNVTGDAHPVHLHLVHFEILGREEIVWDSNTIGPNDPSGEDEDRVIPNALFATPNDDGTYLETQPTVQHNSKAGKPETYGMGFKIVNPTKFGNVAKPAEYFEDAPKDMVTALPAQVTRIKATFDKPGRYVWHCHILSHEDHEMMRVLHVGPGALGKSIAGKAKTAAPATFALAQNYPNPFNPSTTINFQLPSDELVELKIYNRIGQEVRTLVNSGYQAGSHKVVWDGKNNRGRSVASGMYIYRIKAGKHTKSMKMNLVR